MGSFSLVHWLVVLVVVLLLFGRGRVSEIMGDFGKGIKSFKQGLNDENAPAQPPEQAAAQAAPAPPAQIQAPPAAQQAVLNGDTVIDATKSGPR